MKKYVFLLPLFAFLFSSCLKKEPTYTYFQGVITGFDAPDTITLNSVCSVVVYYTGENACSRYGGLNGNWTNDSTINVQAYYLQPDNEEVCAENLPVFANTLRFIPLNLGPIVLHADDEEGINDTIFVKELTLSK